MQGKWAIGGCVWEGPDCSEGKDNRVALEHCCPTYCSQGFVRLHGTRTLSSTGEGENTRKAPSTCGAIKQVGARWQAPGTALVLPFALSACTPFDDMDSCFHVTYWCSAVSLLITHCGTAGEIQQAANQSQFCPGIAFVKEESTQRSMLG